jgi:hypothetical protein
VRFGNDEGEKQNKTKQKGVRIWQFWGTGSSENAFSFDFQRVEFGARRL